MFGPQVWTKFLWQKVLHLTRVSGDLPIANCSAKPLNDLRTCALVTSKDVQLAPDELVAGLRLFMVPHVSWGRGTG